MKALVGHHLDRILWVHRSQRIALRCTDCDAGKHAPHGPARDAIYTHSTMTEGLTVLVATAPLQKYSRAAA